MHLPAGVAQDPYPIICLHCLTRLALPVNTITRECGSLCRPKQPCASPMVTTDVTMGRRSLNLMPNHLRSCSAILHPPRAPCWRLRSSLLIILNPVQLIIHVVSKAASSVIFYDFKKYIPIVKKMISPCKIPIDCFKFNPFKCFSYGSQQRYRSIMYVTITYFCICQITLIYSRSWQ